MATSIINATTSTKIYTLSLHDALPIWPQQVRGHPRDGRRAGRQRRNPGDPAPAGRLGFRSEEHTSELQLNSDIVCRLLHEKKKKVKKETKEFNSSVCLR